MQTRGEERWFVRLANVDQAACEHNWRLVQRNRQVGAIGGQETSFHYFDLLQAKERVNSLPP